LRDKFDRTSLSRISPYYGTMSVQLEWIWNPHAHEYSKERCLGCVSVEVKEAKALPAMDFNAFGRGTSDPYVKLHIGTIEKRTPTIKSNLNPQWNHSWPDIPVHELHQDLCFIVMDEDVLSEHDVIGRVVVPLSLVPPGEKLEGWFHILPVQPNPLAPKGSVPNRYLGITHELADSGILAAGAMKRPRTALGSLKLSIHLKLKKALPWQRIFHPSAGTLIPSINSTDAAAPTYSIRSQMPIRVMQLHGYRLMRFYTYAKQSQVKVQQILEWEDPNHSICAVFVWAYVCLVMQAWHVPILASILIWYLSLSNRGRKREVPSYPDPWTFQSEFAPLEKREHVKGNLMMWQDEAKDIDDFRAKEGDRQNDACDHREDDTEDDEDDINVRETGGMMNRINVNINRIPIVRFWNKMQGKVARLQHITGVVVSLVERCDALFTFQEPLFTWFALMVSLTGSICIAVVLYYIPLHVLAFLAGLSKLLKVPFNQLRQSYSSLLVMTGYASNSLLTPEESKPLKRAPGPRWYYAFFDRIPDVLEMNHRQICLMQYAGNEEKPVEKYPYDLMSNQNMDLRDVSRPSTLDTQPQPSYKIMYVGTGHILRNFLPNMSENQVGMLVPATLGLIFLIAVTFFYKLLKFGLSLD